jgi:hypothetical protein
MKEMIMTRKIKTGDAHAHSGPHQDFLPEAEIGPRAYAIWHARGCPEGTHQDDWFEAIGQLTEERGGKHGPTHGVTAEQTREHNESGKAHDTGPTNRERMIAIGRGNQQSGRHSGRETS